MVRLEKHDISSPAQKGRPDRKSLVVHSVLQMGRNHRLALRDSESTIRSGADPAGIQPKSANDQLRPAKLEFPGKLLPARFSSPLRVAIDRVVFACDQAFKS
jgi:hypothetical protein